MTTASEELERRGWRALTTDAASATAFYGDVLDEEVRMLFPGGLLLTDREQVIESMSGPPWDFHRLSDVDVLHPTPDVAVVSYSVEAQRGGTSYTALVASVYVHRAGGWKMVSHQHTPS